MPAPEREWWLARHARRERTHRSMAGEHSWEACSDADRLWFPQMSVCRVEMETAAAQAQFDRLHEARPWHDGTFTSWAAEPSTSHPYHRTFGTRIWVAETDLGLGGEFTAQENPYEAEEDAHGDSS